MPSTQAVRLRWDAVHGRPATRSTAPIASRPAVGLSGHARSARPTAATWSSYEDSFDLEPATYYYSVVPQDADPRIAAPRLGRVEADQLTTSRASDFISLADAQKSEPESRSRPGRRRPARLAGAPASGPIPGRDMLARLMVGARISLFIGLFAPSLWTIARRPDRRHRRLFGRQDRRVSDARSRISCWRFPSSSSRSSFKVALGGGPGDERHHADAGRDGHTVLDETRRASSAASPAAPRGGVRSGVAASRREAPVPPRAPSAPEHAWASILVSFTFSIPDAIFTEAFLSFIGMGVAAADAELGEHVQRRHQDLSHAPARVPVPGRLHQFGVLAFNLLGDGLRDALDPRMGGT